MEEIFGPYETITKLLMYHFFIFPPMHFEIENYVSKPSICQVYSSPMFECCLTFFCLKLCIVTVFSLPLLTYLMPCQ